MTAKFSKAVKEAARLGDPGEALAILHGLAPNEGWREVLNDRGRLSRRTLALLAGIYLRAERIEEAAEILATGLVLEPVGAGDAIILDPALLTVGGHYHHASLFYRRIIESAGLSATVVRAARSGPTIPDDLTGSRAALAVSQHDRLFPLGIGDRELRSLEALYHRELRRALPGRLPRLVVVPSASHEFVGGLARHLAETAPDRGASVLIGGL